MTIIKKFDTGEVEKPKSCFRFSRKFISFVSLGLFILVLFEVWASNTVVTFGDKLDRVSAMAQSLQMENQILENEIAKKTSLANIASESAMLGFSQTERLQYIR